MISRVVDIKRHRSERQATDVARYSQVLIDKRGDREQLKQALDDFAQWQRDQSERLFAQLSESPATLAELEAFNQTVSGFKVRQNELTQRLGQMETDIVAAREQLRMAREKQRAAERTHRKFEYLAGEMQRRAGLENEQMEERLAEEITGDRAGISHRQLTTGVAFQEV